MISFRKYSVIFLAIMILVSIVAGCREQRINELYRGIQTIEYDSLERSFNIHLPPSYSASQEWPVVVVLHGGGGNARQIERSTGFSNLADKEGFIVVYPNGTGILKSALLTWNAGHCCAYALENNIDDVGFFRAMIDEIESNLNIDSNSIYVTGMSNGGMMTHRLGAECSDIITAIAPVAGSIGGKATINSPLWMPPQPSNPVSVLIIHGTADSHVLYEGGHGPDTTGTRIDLSVAESAECWAKANGCNIDSPLVSNLPGLNYIVYTGGKEETIIEVIVIEDGGHTWPGSDKDSLSKFDAARTIWEFFKNY
jgi:polyhydroxybutyrate depolymerase